MIKNQQKNSSKVTIEAKNSFSDQRLLISRVIDVFSAFEISREKWLTHREKQFFICLVLLASRGIEDMYGSIAISVYKQNYKKEITKKEIYRMADKLKEKNWLIKKRGKPFRIPPLFYSLQEDRPVQMRLDFNNETEVSRSHIGA